MVFVGFKCPLIFCRTRISKSQETLGRRAGERRGIHSASRALLEELAPVRRHFQRSAAGAAGAWRSRRFTARTSQRLRTRLARRTLKRHKCRAPCMPPHHHPPCLSPTTWGCTPPLQRRAVQAGSEALITPIAEAAGTPLPFDPRGAANVARDHFLAGDPSPWSLSQNG